MGTEFRCLTLTPASFGDAGLCVATARAGGIGLLDITSGGDVAVAAAQLRRVEGDIGLRAGVGQADLVASTLAGLGSRPHWLVIAAPEWPRNVAALKQFAAPSRRVLIEITDASQLALIGDFPAAGLVVRGNEAGGWVGEDSTFILLQKVFAGQRLPVYVGGGIGLHGAAACRAAGAAGVVLDDQLLLMPESPLPDQWKRRLASVTGQDARPVGERCGQTIRVLLRPDFGGADRLRQLADAAEAEGVAGDAWRQRAAPLVGWGPPEDHAWPVGQAIGFASGYRNRFKTTGRLLEAYERISAENVELARRLRPLQAGSPLAKSHGTRYPIVQGPMTRVSDSAAFADAVSHAGALPFLALALMTGEQTLALLKETAALLGDRAWGVGLLGFAAHEIREQQMRAIAEVKPPFALIAGGRPDQAAEFERQGIATYVHAPSPELLRLFIDQGARRFVFEGRECGGHIGPLATLILSESQIDVLLQRVSRADAAQFHVLFAGGIHDELSAAMVSAMAAPLVERGMRVGVLVGTGYLFTQEIVATGAVVPEFQQQALACSRTINLESGPGHATRCADTEFGREFYAERMRLLRAREDAEAIREQLESLNLGRLRIASKGLKREPERGIVDLPVEAQRREGMYMIGQAATLRGAVTTLATLHRDIADGSGVLLGRHRAPVRPAASAAKPSDVAIIGVGTLLPKAFAPEQYWSNILDKVSGITEVPRERWDWRLYFDADRHARDKVYAKWGGFLDEVPFDPLRYGIPPRSLKTIDPMQLLALEVVRRALEDAGYGDGEFDRENTSVILGAGGGIGDLGMQYGTRAEIPRVVGATDDAVFDRLPEWSEESFAGSLLNVAAGRVANRFDFGGSNFVTDAACASALAAINIAVNELETGRCPMAIAGGIDTFMSPYAYLCFSKTQALSPQGRTRAFDKNCDGIVIGEGLAVVVLKRLADAERAGDRIYAVIKAIAGSSDGKALGLTAPLPGGQMRALRRAYAKAGFGANTVGMIEAHGTGTPVGDLAEAETIVRTLEAAGAPARSCAVGSVKSLIGHLKGAAGAAGLVKAALALHHRVLPPHAGVTDPLEAIANPASPIYLLNEAKPWLRNGEPRRAGVSAFGFGGTNFHAVLEEYDREFRAGAACAGGARWPCELLLFRGADADDLKAQIARLARALDAGASPRLRDLAFTLAQQAEARADAGAGASIVAAGLDDLRDGLARLTAALEGSEAKLPPQVSLCLAPVDRGAAVAFLFPGQGSQHVNMGREAALYLDSVRAVLEEADHVLDGQLPRRFTDYIYPPAAFGDAEENEYRTRLTQTEVAQPAIGVLSAGLLDFVRGLGLDAAMAAGHSYGEFTALHAAGVLSRHDFLLLSAARGRVMAEACNAPTRGTMAAIMAPREQVEPILQGVDGIGVANHNAPLQVVISGAEDAVKAALAKIAAAGIEGRMLPVAGAFHSSLMAPSKAALDEAISRCEIAAPSLKVYSNITALPYAADPAAISEQLGRHLLSSVEFLAQIERMHADGARVFVELGPKSVLSGLVGQILGTKPHLALSLDGGGMRGLLAAVGRLFTHGVRLSPSALFRGREVESLDLAKLATLQANPPATAWFVSGGCARPPADPVRKSGKLPTLTMETLAEMRRPAPAPALAAAPPAEAAPPVKPASATSAAPAFASPAPAAGAPALAAPVAMDAFHAYQETMRQFLAVQEQVMSRFLEGGAMGYPAAAPPAEAQVPPAVAAAAVAAPPAQPLHASAAAAPATGTSLAPASPPVVTRQSINDLLLGLVSERTGYPAEMLGLERDVEAELGIDSIKRVEILGALQQKLPAGLAARVKQEMETLTRMKTLGGIAERLAAPAPAPSAAAPASVRQPAAATASPPDAKPPLLPALPRCVLEAVPQPLEAVPPVTFTGLFLITEDELSVAAEAAAFIAERGAKPVVVPRDVLTDAAALEAAVGAARDAHGPVRGIVHLAPLARRPASDRLAAWRQDGTRAVKSLYRLLRACADDLARAAEDGQGFVVSASALGGRYGLQAPAEIGPIAGGAAHGLAKTAKGEWPGLAVRVIDFDPAQPPAEMARHLVGEMAGGANELEVGFPAGQRVILRTVPAPLADRGAVRLEPASDWVVLVTGGARGITGELANEIARKGMRMIIVGRTSLPGPEDTETGAVEDPSALRSLLIRRAMVQGAAPTPAKINQQLERLLAERAMRRNLASLAAAGVEVDYHAVDVRDEAAFGSLIDAVYAKHGRLDAVLHGAGIIEDKLLRDKAPDSFDRVYDTKADSVYILAGHLRPDTLKLIVLFTSVAGRIGNRGQGDYAAANEVVNRMAWRLHQQWPDTRVLAVNWGPWESSGMASDAVNQQLRARGIEPIAVPAGRAYFANELRHGAANEVELVVGTGPWATAPAAAGQPAAPLAGDPSYPPLLAPARVGADRSVTVEHTFDLHSHRFLGDHRLEGVPVLPAGAVVEWMAQFIQAAWPDWKVHEIADLRVLNEVRLVADRPKRVVFRGRASSHADAASLKVSVELSDPDSKIIHYRGVAILMAELPEPFVPDAEPLAAGDSLDPALAYRDHLYHGPSFQLVNAIERIGKHGVDADVVPSDPARWLNGNHGGPAHATPSWLFDPGLIDTAPQMAMVWSRLRHDGAPLPTHFGSVTRYGTTGASGGLRLRIRVKANGGDRLFYDAFFIDAAGRVKLAMRNIENSAFEARSGLGSSA